MRRLRKEVREPVELPEGDEDQTPEGSFEAKPPSAAAAPDLEMPAVRPRPPAPQHDIGPRLAEVDRRLADITRLIETRLQYDEQKEQLFNRLYAELNEAKSDQALEAKRPFFMDLLSLLDRIEAVAESEDGDGAARSFADELRYILEKQGVEQMPPAEVLDPRQHRVIGQFSPTAASTRVQPVRPGYRFGDRVLRPQDVLVAEEGAS